MISHGIDNAGVLLPHDRPVKKGGSMAGPTAAQKRMFAKMGIAMPDGSYYIRDAGELSDAIKAVGRGNADHDTIRVHIIKRAAALHLSDQIPDNWNSNGSMKHTTIELGQDFLEHFGTKGMHWGVRNDSTSGGAAKRSELISKAKNHEAISVAHVAAAQHAAKEANEVYDKGVHSAAFKRVYGHQSLEATPLEFYAAHGQSKAYALAQTHSNLVSLHNSYARSANHHSKKAAKLRDKASKIQIQPVTHADVADVLQHFGVKGMHWGVRNVNPGSADHQRAQEVHGLIKTGGVKAASNQDLQDLVTRLNLEQQHARLTATPSRIEAGHTFVKKTIGIGKTGVDAVRTGRQVYGVAKDAKRAYDHYQRGKPLKVVRIGQ
jgi:hypothetical protein